MPKMVSFEIKNGYRCDHSVIGLGINLDEVPEGKVLLEIQSFSFTCLFASSF